MHKETRKHNDGGLVLTGYFTLASVAIGVLLTRSEDTPFWPIFINFILIAILMSYHLDGKSLRNNIIYLSLFTLLGSLFYFMDVNPGVYQILFFVIAAQAMMLLPGFLSYLWIFFLTIISALAFIADSGINGGILTAVVYSGGYLFFGIFGRALMKAQEATQRSDQLLTELQTAHQQLQENILHVEQLAVAKERNRMAREMHDALGHRLTVSAVQLEGAQRLIQKDSARAEEMVTTAREQVKEALVDLRQSVATLREPLETGLEFQQAIKSLILDFENATDLTVNLLIPENFPPISDGYRLALYRSVQESLTNVQRHAKAKHVWIQFEHTQKIIKLTIGDDGKGFKKIEELGSIEKLQGFGIRGIRERVAQLNGECFFENRPGGGAQILISLPSEINTNVN